jgi:predicted nucleic acid-binding protein
LSIYADTSFLVSVYVPDRHSSATDQRMASRPRLWLTPLHSAEWIHAVERQLFQKNLSLDRAQQIYIEFDRDRESGVWVQVALPETAFVVCCDLSRRYTARLGNRTLDTLHVASALELKASSFWTFDERQSKLARAVGLKTD